jgi:proteic killer suppression protein
MSASKLLSAYGRLEALKSDRKGQFSIRFNDQYRLCFRWTNEGPTDVEIVDYH